MIAPMAVGQLLRLLFTPFARKASKPLGKASNTGILIIVLFSVAASASRDDFLPNLRAMPFAFQMISDPRHDPLL